jgi:3-keto-disaccharide hydrolase
MRRLKSLLFVALGCSISLATAAAEEAGFQPLFDGKTLEAFTQKGGKAKYRVENGEIIGTSVPNTENSFLCTNKEYSDFILELEFKVDPQLNSGVQIRSHAYDEAREVETKKGKKRTFPAGRVHGYQVEIDPSPRSYSGAIYDEARRAVFLADLSNNEPARKAFRQGEWNKFRIECRGDSIKTWSNDVPAVDLKDNVTAKGFIALQVHGVGAREEPLEVRWRNLRIKELDSK